MVVVATLPITFIYCININDHTGHFSNWCDIWLLILSILNDQNMETACTAPYNVNIYVHVNTKQPHHMELMKYPVSPCYFLDKLATTTKYCAHKKRVLQCTEIKTKYRSCMHVCIHFAGGNSSPSLTLPLPDDQIVDLKVTFAQ